MTETSAEMNARIDDYINAGVAAAQAETDKYERAVAVASLIRNVSNLDARLIAVAGILTIATIREQMDPLLEAMRELAIELGFDPDEFEAELKAAMGNTA